MNLKIGYFVPEFPMFTHVFFWREIQVLQNSNVDLEYFSTSTPKTGHQGGHDWIKELQSKVTYLLPLSFEFDLVREAFSTPLRRWAAAIMLILTAKDVSFKERLGLFPALILGLKLKRKLRQTQVQHIHSHFCFRGADIVLFSSILSGIPFSISYHGPFWGVGNQRHKWANAAFGICITKHGEDIVTKEVGKENLPPHMFVAPMGVDSDTFTRESTYKPFNGSGPLHIFSAGRICSHKGHGKMVEAVEKLVSEGYDIQLRIAGSDLSGQEYNKKLGELIAARNLTSHVHLLGPISNKKIKEELEETHIFALASFEEPFGVVYAEAMSMEIPTIGTNAGGVPELIQDGVNGFMVEPRDVDSLVRCIRNIARNPDLAVKVGINGRKRVVENFSSRRSPEALLKGIELSGSSRQPSS